MQWIENNPYRWNVQAGVTLLGFIPEMISSIISPHIHLHHAPCPHGHHHPSHQKISTMRWLTPISFYKVNYIYYSDKCEYTSLKHFNCNISHPFLPQNSRYIIIWNNMNLLYTWGVGGGGGYQSMKWILVISSLSKELPINSISSPTGK
jgi:hypothetical protein